MLLLSYLHILFLTHNMQTNGNLSSGEEQDGEDVRMPSSGHVLCPSAASVKRANSLSKKPNGECCCVEGLCLTGAVSC